MQKRRGECNKTKLQLQITEIIFYLLKLYHVTHLANISKLCNISLATLVCFLHGISSCAKPEMSDHHSIGGISHR